MYLQFFSLNLELIQRNNVEQYLIVTWLKSFDKYCEQQMLVHFKNALALSASFEYLFYESTSMDNSTILSVQFLHQLLTTVTLSVLGPNVDVRV